MLMFQLVLHQQFENSPSVLLRCNGAPVVKPIKYIHIMSISILAPDEETEVMSASGPGVKHT